MSKYFTENFVHGDEAILSEKWPFWSLVEALPDEKSRHKRRKIAHIPYFCARFLLKFCYVSRFCKHAKFSKVNAKFSKGVDFFFSANAVFCQNHPNRLIINHLTNPLKIGIFSSKSCFRGEFSKYGGQKRPFCQYLSKKIASPFRQVSVHHDPARRDAAQCPTRRWHSSTGSTRRATTR